MNSKVSKLRSIWNTSKCKMYMFKPKQLPDNAKQTPKFTKTCKQPCTLTLSTLAATSACHFQGNANKSHTWTLNVSSSQFFGNRALQPLATFLFFFFGSGPQLYLYFVLSFVDNVFVRWNIITVFLIILYYDMLN